MPALEREDDVARTTTRRLGVLERLQILRCLTGVPLACGCQAGLYELAGGDLLAVIDEPHERCRNRDHQVDAVIAEDLACPRPGGHDAAA